LIRLTNQTESITTTTITTATSTLSTTATMEAPISTPSLISDHPSNHLLPEGYDVTNIFDEQDELLNDDQGQ